MVNNKKDIVTAHIDFSGILDILRNIKPGDSLYVAMDVDMHNYFAVEMYCRFNPGLVELPDGCKYDKVNELWFRPKYIKDSVILEYAISAISSISLIYRYNNVAKFATNTSIEHSEQINHYQKELEESTKLMNHFTRMTDRATIPQDTMELLRYGGTWTI